MSDQAQGPGWWQASDGKWYPPQEQAATTGDQPPGPGYWKASDGNWYPPQQATAPAPQAQASGWAAFDLPVATSETIPGREIVRYIGPAVGVICRSMGFARGFTGSFKALTRGEVTEYTTTLAEARHEATVRMVQHAASLGGTAVVAMRYDSGDIGEQGGLAEIVAYGTAVVLD